ncbi:hypothetical protein JNB88_13690 [Rhizobium cauense]|uniref:hypothetical protein n=1 Tax=Rhizobium cauense TaxID=1166683 RepID=UPI000561868B|nr:hypothetical protein [Rhizobium cauense]MBW9114696.1 hypothetical protein [Rhizobium cauense]
MKASEYKAAVAVTRLNAAEIVELFGVDLATHQAWVEEREVIPPAVALSLLLMVVTNTNAREASVLVSDCEAA